MKPKFSYPSQTEIPEALRPYYVEKDGKYVIDIEGAVAAERLAEFRDKNIALTKEIGDLKKEWEGFTPSEVKDLVAKKTEIENAKIKSESEFQTKLKERTDAMKAEADKRIAELEGKVKEHESRLAEVVIDKALIEEGTKLGLRPEAADFLTTIGRKSIKLENGVPVIYKSDGKPEYGTDGEPLKIADFVGRVAKANAFAFQPSSGAGSQGGAGSGGSGGGGASDNPFKAGAGFNRTRQGEIFRQDPALARRLAAEAGITLPATNA